MGLSAQVNYSYLLLFNLRFDAHFDVFCSKKLHSTEKGHPYCVLHIVFVSAPPSLVSLNLYTLYKYIDICCYQLADHAIHILHCALLIIL